MTNRQALAALSALGKLETVTVGDSKQDKALGGSNPLPQPRTQFPLPTADGRYVDVLPYDPRGAHVVMRYMGRRMLGEVYDAFRDAKKGGAWFLRVAFLNGEVWPVTPTVEAVEVLIRT